MDAALLFDAAAKKLEMRKMMLASTADLDALGEVIKAQLGFMVKAGDALIKLMDQSVKTQFRNVRSLLKFKIIKYYIKILYLNI